jgi:hypothetical protein
MEDTPLKVLYALVFVLFSFAAPAQTLDVSMMETYYLDQYFGEITEQSTMPSPLVTEPTIEKLGEDMLQADGLAITGSNDGENIPVNAIQPSDENSTVEYTTLSGDQLTEDDTTELSTMPAQIVATEPTTEKLGETVDEAHDVAITGPNDAADVPVGAIGSSVEAERTRQAADGLETASFEE